MLNNTMKYSLLSIIILGLSACTKPRTIIVNQGSVGATPRVVSIQPTKRPDIKEEILLGRGAKSPSLGNRVGVPKNNSSVDTTPKAVRASVVRNGVMERIDFPVNEYKHIKKRGRHTVSGKIYLENSHTSLKINGKKIKLWLNPVTSYSRQWYEESYLGGYKLSKTDTRLYDYLKFTYSNNTGNFNFFGVPSGDYYLTGTISCSKECGFNETKSIRLVKEISVGNGVTRVDLMKNVP